MSLTLSNLFSAIFGSSKSTPAPASSPRENKPWTHIFDKNLDLTANYQSRVDSQIAKCNMADGNPNIWTQKDIDELDCYRSLLQAHGLNRGMATTTTYRPALDYLTGKILEIKRNIQK